MILSANELIRLGTSEDLEEYNRAAREEASEEVWLEVIEKYPKMKKWVVQNKKVQLNILRILSDDPDPEVRWWVAFKRKLDRTLFEKLAHDEDESVRKRIACNKKTPDDVLEILASDTSKFVSQSAKERLKDK